MLDPAHKARVYRQAGWISPALLVNGRIEGVWSWELKGKRLRVEVEPFAPAPKWVRTAIERDAEKLAAFLGGELSLGWV